MISVRIFLKLQQLIIIIRYHFNFKSTVNPSNGNGSKITTDFGRADVKESEC